MHEEAAAGAASHALTLLDRNDLENQREGSVLRGAGRIRKVGLCSGTWLEGGNKLTGKDPEEMIRYFGATKIRKIHFRNVSAPLPHFVETFMDNGYYDLTSSSPSRTDILACKWTVTILDRIAQGLAVVHRRAYPEIPPRVVYELTDRGRRLVELINVIVQFADG